MKKSKNTLDLSNFSSSIAKVKYAACKEAVRISKEAPEKIYKDLDFFIDLLTSENSIYVWTALSVIGNLTIVDSGNRIDGIIPQLLKFVQSSRMITSANAIACLVEVARKKPKHKDKIIENLLKVEKQTYLMKGKKSPECRNIAIGHLLDGLMSLDDDILKKSSIVKFIKRQTKNTRNSVSRRAIKILKKIKKEVNEII